VVVIWEDSVAHIAGYAATRVVCADHTVVVEATQVVCVVILEDSAAHIAGSAATQVVCVVILEDSAAHIAGSALVDLPSYNIIQYN